MKTLWVKAETMPDFDGEYLCFIVVKNECGTYSKIQRVLECKTNKWAIPEGCEWRVTHWAKLPEQPERTIKLLG